MKYMLAIHADESRWETASPEEIGGWMAAYGRFSEAAAEAGVLNGGDGLQPSSTATTVRVRDGETLLTDGPFAETKEQLNGFYLLDVDSLDDALAWAARIPDAAGGAVEVRPVMVYEDMPGAPAADAAAGAAS
jgi:hypothetical protein